jgi:hypothetical protein
MRTVVVPRAVVGRATRHSKEPTMERTEAPDDSILGLRGEIAVVKRRLRDQFVEDRAIRAELERVARALGAAESDEERAVLAQRRYGLEVALRVHAAHIERSKAAVKRLSRQHDDARRRRNRDIGARKEKQAS